MPLLSGFFSPYSALLNGCSVLIDMELLFNYESFARFHGYDLVITHSHCNQVYVRFEEM